MYYAETAGGKERETRERVVYRYSLWNVNRGVTDRFSPLGRLSVVGGIYVVYGLNSSR